MAEVKHLKLLQEISMSYWISINCGGSPRSQHTPFHCLRFIHGSSNVQNHAGMVVGLRLSLSRCFLGREYILFQRRFYW